ncbi:MAG TPA: thioredoxin family protein [Opitutus sp.]|nr:thioredoxin family protein [Opitutus sp.]
MKILVSLLLAFSGVVAWAATPAEETFEREVRELVQRPQVTVVHFWAPWCPNCQREMRPDGWAKFVADNPNVTVVFLNIWHGGLDPAPKLAAGKLGGQPNFIAMTHPNPSRRKGEQLSRLLDLPVGWVPTTWVFRDGKQRYALNYGEVRFEMLQQMVDDASRKW